MIVKHNGRLVPRQGAVPLLRGGDVMGAVGASGADPQEDEDIAAAGAAVGMFPAVFLPVRLKCDTLTNQFLTQPIQVR